MNMIFTAWQLQEKCHEQQRELYAVFIDLTKAFDSVDRSALWEVLLRIGCPPDFVSIIHWFHEGMRAAVMRLARCLQTLLLPVAPNKAVLWPHFCSLSSLPWCFELHSRIARLVSPSITALMVMCSTCDACCAIFFSQMTVQCALVAHTPAEVQLLFDRFFNAAKRFTAGDDTCTEVRRQVLLSWQLLVQHHLSG